MPKIDLTVSVSVILALCAILVPSVTAFLNNRHQYKLEKLRLDHQLKLSSIAYRRNVYENYLKNVGYCIHYCDETAESEYGKSYPLALVYFPDDLHPRVSKINQLIRSGKMDEAIVELEELTPLVKKQLQQL